MAEPTKEERANLRRLAELVRGAREAHGVHRSIISLNALEDRRRALHGAIDDATVLSLLDALDAAQAAMAELKSKLRKFVPSARDHRYCRNCEEPRHEHYSGPFAEPDTLYCSKYFVPRGPR